MSIAAYTILLGPPSSIGLDEAANLSRPEAPPMTSSADTWALVWRAARAGRVRLIGDAWAEAGVAGELARAGEAADVTDLGGDRGGEHPTDPGYRQQERHVAVVGAEPA